MLACSVGSGVSLGASPLHSTHQLSSYLISGCPQTNAPRYACSPGVTPKFQTPWPVWHSSSMFDSLTVCAQASPPRLPKGPSLQHSAAHTPLGSACPHTPRVHEVPVYHLDCPAQSSQPHTPLQAHQSQLCPSSGLPPLPPPLTDPPRAHNLPPPQDWAQRPPPNKAVNAFLQRSI